MSVEGGPRGAGRCQDSGMKGTRSWPNSCSSTATPASLTASGVPSFAERPSSAAAAAVPDNEPRVTGIARGCSASFAVLLSDRPLSRREEPRQVAARRTTFIEITAQTLRVGARIRQSDVAVRPDEVERRAHQAGSPHSLPPLKMVERKLELGAGLGHAGLRLSVHVNLPPQRGERIEVVLSRP